MLIKLLKVIGIFHLCSFACFGLPALQEMTLEQKIGQLLLVHFHGEAPNEEAKTLIHDIGVGGIIYYNWSNGLRSPEQVQNLSHGLQKLAQSNHLSIPLFIAVDQEGGIVSRLNEGFTIFPGNRALGEAGDADLAFAAAAAMGQELKAVGINMNFAPVVDVNLNPFNPIIGIRSFGENAEKVALFGERSLLGFKQAGIMAVLKHFPGHGDAGGDSHQELPVIAKKMKELEQVELLPFAKLAASADLMMTAHLLVPALDAENCSTLSAPTINYLKGKLGFTGAVITDSLVMEGVLKKCQTVEEAALQSIQAGCDILLLGGRQLIDKDSGLELMVDDIWRIHGSLVSAVKSGRISDVRINEAAEKILRLKERYLVGKEAPLSELSQYINTPKHREIAQRIASPALKVIQGKPCWFPSVEEQKIAVFAPQAIQGSIVKTSLATMGTSTLLHFFADLNPSAEEVVAVTQIAENADLLLFCAYNTWSNPAQSLLVRALMKTNKPVILLISKDPVDALLFPDADLIFITHSPSPASIQCVCDLLINPG